MQGSPLARAQGGGGHRESDIRVNQKWGHADVWKQGGRKPRGVALLRFRDRVCAGANDLLAPRRTLPAPSGLLGATCLLSWPMGALIT